MSFAPAPDPEQSIASLIEHAQADLDAVAWLVDFVAAAYGVIDSWEFGNLAEAVTDLGNLLPVRVEP